MGSSRSHSTKKLKLETIPQFVNDPNSAESLLLNLSSSNKKIRRPNNYETELLREKAVENFGLRRDLTISQQPLRRNIYRATPIQTSQIKSHQQERYNQYITPLKSQPPPPLKLLQHITPLKSQPPPPVKLPQQPKVNEDGMKNKHSITTDFSVDAFF